MANNNSSGKIVSPYTNTYNELTRNDPIYDNPREPASGTGKGPLSPDLDEHLYSSKPLPKMQNFKKSPCYDGAAFTAGAASRTADEPLYAITDVVRQSGE